MSNTSPRYLSQFEISFNVLAPLLSSLRDVLSLMSFDGNQEKHIAQDVGGLTSRVNGNVVARSVQYG